MAESAFLRALKAIRPGLARAAQKVYDDWEQDCEGIDECYGAGGICDDVAEALAGVIAMAFSDVHLYQGGQEGDDHAWTLVRRGQEGYGVDISTGVYESGSGYCWKKKPGIRFKPEDIEIFPVDWTPEE